MNKNVYEHNLKTLNQNIDFEYLVEALKKLEKPLDDYSPPYNIVKVGDTFTRIDVHAVGFSKNEITVVSENGLITIEGKTKRTGEKYSHQGFAYRDFKKTFTVFQNHMVTDVRLEHGLVSITIQRLTPKHQEKKIYTL